MKTHIMSGLLLLGTITAPAQAQSAPKPITGKWLTENDEAIVEIAPCGTFLCGKVFKVLRAKSGEASPPGTPILTELVRSGSLWKGRIRDPRSGKVYNAKVSANPDGTLKVEGCVAFLCQGPTWRPAT